MAETHKSVSSSVGNETKKADATMHGWLDRINKRFFSFTSAASSAAFTEATPCAASAEQDQSSQESDKQNEPPVIAPHDVHRLSTRIDHSLTALPQACNRTETDFLNIGKQLQDIYAEAERLTQMAQEAVGCVATDTDESASAGIIDKAHETLGDLKKEQSVMAGHAETIASLCANVGKLNGLTVGFGRIAKDLKMVAININIESTRNEASRESFSILSQEIRELSNTVADLGQTLRDEIQAITTKLETMGQKVDADMRRLNQLLDDAKRVIDRAIPEYRTLMTSSVQTLDFVSTNSANISRSTSQIVVNLQIHDNVSQRVEHVAEALADAKNLLSDVIPTKQMSDGDGDWISAVFANLTIQGSQLATIVRDIDAVYQESARSFGVLDDTVRDITSTIVKIARGNDTGALDGEETFGSLDSFQAALKKIQDLIGESDEAVDGISGIEQDATAAAASIDDHIKSVKRVNFDIHLKSLNAIFKSVQLGDQGRSIGILVKEMKTLATQSNELVEKIESINKSIVDHVHQLKSDGGTTRSRVRQETATGEKRFDDLVTDFFHRRDSFNRLSEEMATLGKRLAALIGAAGDQLSFIVPFTRELTSHQKQLDESREALAQWCNLDEASVLDEARLSERYTMEQERLVHESALDGTSDADRQSEAPEDVILFTGDTGTEQKRDDSQQEDDFGDNVELF